MNDADPQPVRRPLWVWVALAVAVIAGASAVGLWARPDPGPGRQDSDCVIVDDAARQWNMTAQQVIGMLLNSAANPDAFSKVADQQAAAAGKLRTAADSVTTPQIKQYLTDWADAAAQDAVLHRAAADRAPGQPVPAGTEQELQRVATSINDAAVALGELCPGSSTAPQ